MKILFEDRHIVVVVKDPGELSEAAEGDPASLITLLDAHFAQSAQPRAKAYPIHRLDRNVGGLMIFAKNKAAAGKLSAAVGNGQLIKEYFAVVHGTPVPAEGILEDLLWKDARKNKTFVVTRNRKGVREAKLAYRVLFTTENLSAVHVRLYTGRSHQIRVQFASRKMPLFGDGKYGAKDNAPLALCSCRLRLNHPVTGAPISFSWLPPSLGGLSLPSELPPFSEA